MSNALSGWPNKDPHVITPESKRTISNLLSYAPRSSGSLPNGHTTLAGATLSRSFAWVCSLNKTTLYENSLASFSIISSSGQPAEGCEKNGNGRRLGKGDKVRAKR